jgi:predicted nucleic acid-binding protein
MRAGDAIIAATAVENYIPLVTANKKHFKDIAGLELKIFTP